MGLQLPPLGAPVDLRHACHGWVFPACCLLPFYAPRNQMFIALNGLSGEGGVPSLREVEKHSRTFQHLPPCASLSSSHSDFPKASSYLLQGLCSCRSLCWNAFPSTAPFHHSYLCSFPLLRKASSSQTQAARPPGIPSPCFIFTSSPHLFFAEMISFDTFVYCF